ncbi:hypothetical protein OJ405_002381 [Salmonella enterica]|nr:hypothetical protein [Salmonella enterica]ELS1746266.1 hypothetical protein [Salmonella enterica]ELW3720649.1 hypothetical protein [Salmonella enterica]EMB7326665.1 hypothetical protein [Salmonella enterica]
MENLEVVSVLDFYIEKVFYIFGLILLGMAWLTYRAGSNYHHFKNGEKSVTEGRGSFSCDERPEMIRRLKFQALIWYIANGVLLVFSTIIFGFLFYLLHYQSDLL